MKKKLVEFLSDFLMLPLVFVKYIFHFHTKYPVLHNRKKIEDGEYRLSLNFKKVSRYIFAIMALFLLSPTVSLAAEYACPGENVQNINNTTDDATKSYSENNPEGFFEDQSGLSRYFKFKTQVSGEITISFDNTSNRKQAMRIGTTCGANDIYGSGNKNSASKTFYVTAGKWYYVQMQERNSQNYLKFRITFDFEKKVADIEFTEKSSPTPSPVNVNDEVTFSVRAHNYGTDAAKPNIVAKFSYNMDVDIVSVVKGSDFSCDVTSGSLTAGSFITCTKSNVWSNLNANKDFTIKVKPTATGTLTQTATIESLKTTDPDTSNNSVQSSVTVNGGTPVAQISKSVDNASPEVGDEITFTIVTTLKNSNAWLDMEDDIEGKKGSSWETTSGAFQLVSYSVDKSNDVTCQISNQVLKCATNNEVNPNYTYTVTVKAKVLKEGSLTNTAWAQTGDSNAWLGDWVKSAVTVTATTASNQPPVASNVDVSTAADTPVTIHLDATDPDGDTIQSYPIVNGPSHGQLSGAEPDITYTPDSGYAGTDTFSYKACDDKGACSNEANVTITINSGPQPDPNPPVCIESTSYGSSGDIGACFNSGVFQTGAGCRQNIKLRNLTNEPIDDAVVAIDYNLFNGSAGQRCGIDGVDQTGNDCNLTHSIDFGPIGIFNNAATFDTGSFDSLENHTIFTEAALSHDFSFLENNTYIKYTKNGQEYVGSVQKCEIDTTSNDLCWEKRETIKKGFGLCFDFGFFSFGAATGGCGKEIYLKNQGGSELTDVSTNLITDSLFNGHMIDDCLIDGSSTSNCSQGDVMDFGFMGMSGLFQGSSVSFDPLPDFSTNDTHTIATLSKINMKVFPSSQLFGTYITTDADGNSQLNQGEIKQCTGWKPDNPNFEQCGLFPSALNTWHNINRGNGDIVIDADTVYANNVVGVGNQDIECTTAQGTQSCDITPMRQDPLLLPAFIPTNEGGSQTASSTETDLGYGDVTVNSNVHFSPSGTYDNGDPVMLMHSLTVNNGVTVTFDEGDYWIGSLTANQGVTIRTNGKVRLFIGQDLTLVQNMLDINYDNGNGNPGNLFIFVYGDFTWAGQGGGANQDMAAYVYVNGEYTSNMNTANSHFKGAITAVGDINLNNNQEYVYDDSGLGVWGPCACVTVEFDRDHYDVREDINYIGTTETVRPIVVLDHAVSYDVTVHYHTEDGTATVADGDYIQVNDGTVTIPAGDLNASIPIYIYNDRPIELDEYFFVQLTNPSDDACLGDQNRTQINILAQEDSPVCFEDDFDNGLDSKWRVLKASGGFTPEVVSVGSDKRLRLTDRSHNLSTVITKDYEFDTRYNLIIVEFDYYAYGGCSNGSNYKETHGSNYMGEWGADGIVNVLFDSSVGAEPTPGGLGGSLGYAQMTPRNMEGFEGGWLGLGLDEFGNYAKPNEGKIGGINDQYVNAVSIRGDGNGFSGYEYLAGTTTLTPPLANKLSDAIPSGGYYSGRYKMTIDARDPNHLYIRLQRSLDHGATYSTIIDRFDAKNPVDLQDPSYAQLDTPEKIRYAISAGTGGGCNNHEISWIKLRGNCASYHTPSYNTGPFDAWDTFRGDTNGDGIIDDRNISTKVVNAPFNLKLASTEPDNTVATKPGITRVYYGLIKRHGPHNFTYLVDPMTQPVLNFDSTAVFEKEFNVASAVPDAEVVFRFCADFNGTTYTLYPPDINCSTQASVVLWPDETNMIGWRETLASDAFAVRPDRFEIEGAPTTETAGHEFAVTLHAVDANGNNVKDYNETININALASPSLDNNDTNPNCQPSSRQLTATGGFADGLANVNLNYNEVGELKIRLTEHNNSDYAHYDFDDTDFNQSVHDSPNQNLGGNIYREITAAETTIDFVADHFKLHNIALHDHHEAIDANFTYLASVESAPTVHDQIDKHMAARLDFSITAENEQNGTTYNYNSACYAQDITVGIDYLIDGATASAVNPGILSTILYRWYDDNTTVNEYNDNAPLGAALSLKGIGGSAKLQKSVFNPDHNGTANIKLQINFDRDYTNPVNPFRFSVTDIDVSDDTVTGMTITDNNSSAKADNNATFIYGRARPSKYLYEDVTANSIVTPIMVQVYCDKLASSINCPGVDIVNGQTNEYQWYLSTKHDMSNNDGNVTLQASTAGALVTPSVVSINSGDNGKDNAISVQRGTATLPAMVDIDFVTTNPTDTSLWLIYNKDNDAIPSPFYRVHFIGIGDWAGHGTTGSVMETNASETKNRRLGW